MKDTRIELLFVDSDDDVAAMMVDYLERALADKHSTVAIRRAHNASEAIDMFFARPADVVVAELDFPDRSGITMVRAMRAHADCAVLIVTAQPTLGKTVELMRLGVIDLLVKPCDLGRLGTVVERAVADQIQKRHTQTRQRRLRALAGRIVRERRELRRRMDLVCNDLVGAYRELASKVSERSAQGDDS